jgi:hypothetical protein
MKTAPPISRQARWQHKHKAMGLCIQCNRPVFRALRCRKHHNLCALKRRLSYVPKRRGRYGDVTEKALRAKLKRLTGGTQAKKRN